VDSGGSVSYRGELATEVYDVVGPWFGESPGCLQRIEGSGCHDGVGQVRDDVGGLATAL
jgi:hypothetical protein